MTGNPLLSLKRARGYVEDASLRCMQNGRLLPPELRVLLVALWPLRALRLVTLPEPEVAVHDDWVDALDAADGGDEEAPGF